MKKFFNSEKFNIIYSVAALLLMWAVWAVAAACVKNEYVFPPFGSVTKEFFSLFATAFFWRALAHTLLRTLIAFIISFVLGAACAVLGAAFKPFAAFMRPIVSVLRTLPTMAVLLLILTWFTPRTAPVAVTFLVLFPMIYSQFVAALGEVDEELLQMAKAYNFSRKSVLTNIYLHSVAPQTVLNTGANLSFGIKLTVSAEIMAATYTALGGMMAEAQIYNLARLAALTVCAVLIGLIIEIIFRSIYKFAFVWKKGEGAV